MAQAQQTTMKRIASELGVSVTTISNGPQCFGAGRFNISVRNFAEALLSLADRIVWLKWTAMSLLPG